MNTENFLSHRDYYVFAEKCYTFPDCRIMANILLQITVNGFLSLQNHSSHLNIFRVLHAKRVVTFIVLIHVNLCCKFNVVLREAVELTGLRIRSGMCIAH